MSNAAKIKIFLAIIIVAISAALFFYFKRTDNPKNIVGQPDNKKIENNQDYVPAGSETVSGSETDTPKTTPSAIPIFMYHYIQDYSDARDPIGENLSVSPEKFEEQISWLKEDGYQTVFLGYFVNPQPVSFKPIILTFDDGYQDAYDSAFPVLKKNGMAGIFYLIVDRIGTPGYLTWEEIREMKNSGMAFGSHTLSHADLRNLSKADLEKELRDSRTILEEKIGGDIKDFCYPSGKYNEEVLGELKLDGYETAVTTASGISDLKTDPYQLKRLRIEQSTKIQKIMPE